MVRRKCLDEDKGGCGDIFGCHTQEETLSCANCTLNCCNLPTPGEKVSHGFCDPCLTRIMTERGHSMGQAAMA